MKNDWCIGTALAEGSLRCGFDGKITCENIRSMPYVVFVRENLLTCACCSRLTLFVALSARRTVLWEPWGIENVDYRQYVSLHDGRPGHGLFLLENTLSEDRYSWRVDRCDFLDSLCCVHECPLNHKVMKWREECNQCRVRISIKFRSCEASMRQLICVGNNKLGDSVSYVQFCHDAASFQISQQIWTDC